MTKADLVERVTEQISRTAGPMISKKDCARVVDALKSESYLDLCKAALAAPVHDWIGKATMLRGSAPLAARLIA